MGDDNQKQLFAALDAITARVKAIEENVLVKVAGAWIPEGMPFSVQKHTGKWQVCWRDEQGHIHPVSNSKVEVRMEFAKRSVEFVDAYLAWTRNRVNQMNQDAQEALRCMAEIEVEADCGVKR